MADKSKIAAHYLASSPPGQLADVERGEILASRPQPHSPLTAD